MWIEVLEVNYVTWNCKIFDYLENVKINKNSIVLISLLYNKRCSLSKIKKIFSQNSLQKWNILFLRDMNKIKNNLKMIIKVWVFLLIYFCTPLSRLFKSIFCFIFVFKRLMHFIIIENKRTLINDWRERKNKYGFMLLLIN